MQKTRFLIMGLFLSLCLPVQSAVFDIADGDIAGLIAAIDAANNNGDVINVINLANNSQYTLSQVYETIQISGRDYGAVGLPKLAIGKTLTINGNGSRIIRASASPRFRFLFASQNSSLNLNDLSFENGESSSFGGGALFVEFQTTADIRNCKFIANRDINRFGGAIYINNRNSVSLRNCEFLNNRSYKHGGGVYNVLSDLLVENCLFKENATTFPNGRASGGGLYIDGARVDNDAGEITIRNTRFEGNRANPNGPSSNEGGGLYLYGYNDNTLLVDQCTFINNVSRGFGGGMLVDNESIDDIKPNNVSITVQNCLIANNRCIRSQGGGIWAGGIQSQEPASSSASTDIINCTIVYNQAGSYGGGIANYLIGTNVMNCTIAYNEAEISGGGIFKNIPLNLNNSIIAFNQVNTPTGNRANCGSLYQGSNNIQFPDILAVNDDYCSPGIMIADPLLGPLQDNGGPTLTMALLPGSPAIDAGGNFGLTPGLDSRGVATEGSKDIGAYEYSSVGVIVNTPTNLNAVSVGQNEINLTWGDNSSNEQGFIIQRSEGNIFNFETIQTLGPNLSTFSDANLEANTTYYYRVRAFGGESVEWSNLSGASTATDKACDNNLYKPEIITNPNAIVGNGTPESCTQDALQAALNVGGKIVCNCGEDPLTINLSRELEVKMTGTVFDGGGRVSLSGNNLTRILKVDEGIDFTIQNTRLINGLAPNSGGLFAESGGAILVGSGITGNGGGLLKVISCEFENNSIANMNTAERGGGAIYAYRLRDLIISESSFTNNSANVGGAIGGLGSQVTLINSRFMDNEAAGTEAFLSGVGGAIYLDGIDLWDINDNQDHHFSICGTSFQGNQAKHEGGALYMAISDSKRNQFKVDRSSFIDNQLISPNNGNGGAIFHVEDDYTGNNDDPAENFIIENSTFSGNSSQKQGGAIWTITGGGARIENCTFDGNAVLAAGGSLGGALAISSAGYGANFVLNNNTFSNNTSAHFAGAIFAGADNNVDIRNSILYNNTSDFEWEGHQFAGPATFTGTSNIQFPENRWNGTPDNVLPGRLEPISDPLLNPLALNGGFTQTLALQENSPAIDAANSGTSTDQRGLLAVDARDIGAYEFGAVFSDAPVILSFDPVSGNLGSTVTISGYGFTGATAVAFNFNFATEFTVLDDQTIEVMVPDFATTGKISVSTAFGTGYSEDDYTVIIPLPTISGFNPNQGTSGTLVSISGTGFTGATEVLFNDALAANFTIIDEETIEATVPLNATSGKISISTGGGTAVSADDFVVIPSLVSFNPQFGRVGTEVLIQGTNLLGTTSVRFAGVEASSFVVESGTSIRATVANGTPFGAAPIEITAGDANDYSSLDNFTLLAAPNITNINPNAGTAADAISITGTNFTQLERVEFNGVNAEFALVNSNSIIAYVPEAATTGTIEVSTPGGSATSSIFTVLPNIASFLPTAGGTGTEVIVYGTNLSNVVSVSVGGVNTSFTPIDATSISLSIGTGATGVITIITNDGTAVSEDTFTFVNAPTITNIAVNPGPEAVLGSLVTVTGTNFIDASELLINGVSILDFDINVDGTSISFNLPSNVNSGQITVVGVGGSVTSAASLIVRPSITSFSPVRGAEGTTVTIEGANFSGLSALSFNGTPASSFTVVNDRRVTAVVAGTSTTGPISVEVGGQSAISNNDFEFIPAPTITNVNPVSGLVGEVITITGTNFLVGETSISFNGTHAPTFSVLDANTISVTIPNGASSGLLRVTTTGGEASENFTIAPPLPVITNFTPQEGVIGTRVSISGSNLGTTTEVQFFNGVLATNITITDDLISAVVPLGAITGPITLITSSGNTSTSTDFTVIPPPAPIITDFNPKNAPVGSAVSITGDNFTNATEVTFNGVIANFTVVNDGRITAEVPNATTGLIALSTPGGSASSSEDFVIPFVWTGNQDSNWGEALNWSPNVVPNGNEVDVLIPNTANDPVLDNNTALLRNVNIENGASLELGANGNLELKGEIINQGVFIGDGTLLLSGNMQQIIPASIERLNNLQINNPQSILLSDDLELSGILDFQLGNLELEGHTLDLGNSGSLNNESETSHISGALGSVVAVRTGASDFLNNGLNVGNMGADITIPTQAGLAGITVLRGHRSRGDANQGIERYFAISPAGVSTNLNATLRFKYLESELIGIPEDALILYRFNGINWEPKMATQRNLAANQLILANIPQFSEWTAGDVSLPLPVTLLEFKAQRRDEQSVELFWSSVQEEQVRHYEVQKSRDGHVFESIAQVDIQAESTELKQYTFLDQQAGQAAYYRLKFIENSGPSTHSNPVFVSGSESSIFEVYPNPSTESIKVKINSQDKFYFQLKDIRGQVLTAGRGTREEMEDKINDLLPHLEGGMYLIRVEDGTQRYETKLLKQ